MLRSLRFRLPALFLLGIVLAGVVATLIAVRFFQSYTRTHAASELRAESVGIVELYQRQAGEGQVFKLPLGRDRVFWVPVVPGASLLAGSLPELPRSEVTLAKLPGQAPGLRFPLPRRGVSRRRASRAARKAPRRSARRCQAGGGLA